MASEDVWGLNPRQYANFERMEAQFLRNPNGAGELRPDGPKRFENRPPIIAALLDDLTAGQAVQAAVLSKRSSNSIQFITAYGTPPTGYFKVGVKISTSDTLEWTPNFYPVVDDAAVLQKYLSRMEKVGRGNVTVSMGLRTTPEDQVNHNLWRWEIVWRGIFENIDMPLVQVETHLAGAGMLVTANNPLEDTGRLETVHECLGVGTPTPLRAGARVMASWVNEIGYVVHACEVRDFGDYGLFQ